MNRFELGQKLKKLRGTKMLSNSVISANVIDSIENGKASYSVKKLLLYCGITGITPAIYITLLDETRPIITVLDFHKAIARMLDIYDETVDETLMVRRFYLFFGNVKKKEDVRDRIVVEQFDLLAEPAEDRHEKEEKNLEKDEKIQQAMLDIRKRFGKNSVLKGTSLEDGATGKDRNKQIGGHKE